MEYETPKATPILQLAWARFSELDTNASARTKSHIHKRRWIAILGVLATLFAVLSQLFPENTKPAILGLSFRILLIATPLVGSAMAAFTKSFYSTGDWLIMRAGAEEVLKEIYFFRTILQKKPNRRAYLEKRLTEIQRQLYRSMGGELVLEPYDGEAHSRFYPNDPTSDFGLDDLTGEDYFKYRVENQLAWHRKKVRKHQATRVKLQILILASGGLGAFLAALGGGFSLWVALTASLTAAFLGWQELRNTDNIVKNYSKLIVELSVIYDHWINLEHEERTEAEFFRMVHSTEEILWNQNMEYIKSMQEALKDADLDEEADLINRVVKESVDSAKVTKQAMADSIVDHTKETLEETEEKVEETVKAALGSLAEEASTELVQQELQAMSEAVLEMAEEAMERVGSLTSSLADIAKEFAHVDIGRDTTKEELNEILSRFPKSNDVKG
ncbi:MAG TPA: SLATT domain-containing protein [Anaerolineales bacterium]|nr:SLATT domain-containing protein [Anaerolineales bacterium]